MPFKMKTRGSSSYGSSAYGRKASSRGSATLKATEARGKKQPRSIRPGTCANCGCTEKYTNLWRSDRDNEVIRRGDPIGSKAMLCNACGLWLNEKGTMRPPHLWKKWREGARKEAEQALQRAVDEGADPSTLSIDDFMPAAAPVMPIAAVRGGASSPPPSPPSSRAAPSPASRARSHSLAPPPPAITENVYADHDAASALLGFSQAWKQTYPSAPTTSFPPREPSRVASSSVSWQPVPPPTFRFLEVGNGYLPSWMSTMRPVTPVLPPGYRYRPEPRPHFPRSNTFPQIPAPGPSNQPARTTQRNRSALSIAELVNPSPALSPSRQQRRQHAATAPSSRPLTPPSYFPPRAHEEQRYSALSSTSSSPQGPTPPSRPSSSRRVSSASDDSVDSALLRTPGDAASVLPEATIPMGKLQLDEGQMLRRRREREWHE